MKKTLEFCQKVWWMIYHLWWKNAWALSTRSIHRISIVSYIYCFISSCSSRQCERDISSYLLLRTDVSYHFSSFKSSTKRCAVRTSASTSESSSTIESAHATESLVLHGTQYSLLMTFLLLLFHNRSERILNAWSVSTEKVGCWTGFKFDLTVTYFLMCCRIIYNDAA